MPTVYKRGRAEVPPKVQGPGMVLSPPTLMGSDTPPRIEASVENEPKPLTQPRTVRGKVQLATASLQRAERKSAVEMLSPRHTALLLPPTATEVQVLAVAFDPRADKMSRCGANL